MIEIKVDLHTHTVASTHAFSTVTENAKEAKRLGLEAFAVTDHGPGLPDGAHIWHFTNLNSIPRELEGVKVIRGAECSFQNKEAELDLPERALKKMEIVIGSVHPPVYVPQTTDEATALILKAIENPYLDILGHMDRTKFSAIPDYDIVVPRAVENDKIIEFNAHSLDKGEEHNTRNLLKACKKYGATIAVNSDAHFYSTLGRFDECIKILEEIGIGEEQIINTNYEKVKEYIDKKMKIKENL